MSIDEEAIRLSTINQLKLIRDRNIAEIDQGGGPDVDIEARMTKVDIDYLTALRNLKPPLIPILTRDGKIVDVNVKLN